MSTVPALAAGVAAVVGAVGVKSFAGDQAGGLSAMVGVMVAIAVYTVVKDLTKPKQVKNVDEGFDDLDITPIKQAEAPKKPKKKKPTSRSSKKKKAQAAAAAAPKAAAPAPKKKEAPAPAPASSGEKKLSKSAKAKAKAKRQAANKKAANKKPMDETSKLLAEAARLKALADEAAAKAEQAQRLLNKAAAATGGKKKKKGKKGGNKAAAAAAEETKAAVPAYKKDNFVEEEGWTTMREKKSSKERRQEAQAKLARELAAQKILNGEDDDDDDEVVEPKDEAVGEMKIASKHYGAIIGKGGSNLQLLQSALGVHISMPKKGTDDQNVKITGSAAAVEACEVALNELVQLGYSSVTHPDTQNQSIDVPEKFYSVLIGPKGANIKAIQTKTDTRINMPEKGGDNTLVTITGGLENVMMAKAAIKQLMSQGYSDLTHEGWTSIDMHFPSSRMSDLIGSGGATIRSIQKDTGCRIDTPGPDSVSQNTITISGPVDSVSECRARVVELSVVEEVEQDPAWAVDNEFDLVSINSWD